MKQTLPGNPKFIRTNWRNILLWLVPVIALLTSLSILVQTKLTKGPEITISFRSAAGLEAGKTTVKYKDVTVGIVKEIILSADNSAVLARVQLAKVRRALSVKIPASGWSDRVSVSAGSAASIRSSPAHILVWTKGNQSKAGANFTGWKRPDAHW